MPTINDQLFRDSVRHQIGLVRVSTGLVKKLVGQLNKSQLRMLDALTRADVGDGSYNEHRLNELIGNIRSIGAQAATDVADTLDKDLEHLTQYEVNRVVQALRTLVPKAIQGKKEMRVALIVNEPGPEQVFASVWARPFQGKLLKDWYAALEGSIVEPVLGAIRQGYADGLTTDVIVRTLRGTRASKYTDGILQQPRRAVERTVRTAVNHTATYAREQTYKANDDLIKAVRWVSTLDMRTSDTCIALDGQIFDVDSGPRPPAHLNCRSTTTPVLKSWKELGFDIEELPEGTRASMDGQVPASMTYGEWLASQSAAVQDDVLGPTRAALFRDGGLTVDKFVDEAGHSLTLDQLRQREAEAFAEIEE